MSKLYTSIQSDCTKTTGTKRGHRWVRSSIQSWNGSLITTMNYNINNETDPQITIEKSNTSSMGGDIIFHGTLSGLEYILRNSNELL